MVILCGDRALVTFKSYPVINVKKCEGKFILLKPVYGGQMTIHNLRKKTKKEEKKQKKHGDKKGRNIRTKFMFKLAIAST